MDFPKIDLIVDGQDVDAATTNNHIKKLATRTDTLKNLLDTIILNYTKMPIVDALCDDACSNNMIVYFDGTIDKWKPAYLGYEPEGTPPVYSISKTAYAKGIVQNITGTPGNRTGTVYIAGVVEISNINELLKSGETLDVGAAYYLTDDQLGAGRITNIKPAVPVYIGQFLTSQKFLVAIDLSSIDSRHNHFYFKMIKSMFQEIAGVEWLYESSDFPKFPPVPYESAILIINNQIYPYNETDWKVDADGLHYYLTTPLPSDTAFDCYIYYLMPSTNSFFGVQSIMSKTENVIITDCTSGELAATGNLDIGVYLQLVADEVLKSGGMVIKDLIVDSQSGKITVKYGNVIASASAGQGIVLENKDGALKISAPLNDRLDSIVDDITLKNAKQKVIDGTAISYIEFPNDYQASILLKIVIPANAPSAIDLSMDFFGTKSEQTDARFLIRYKLVRQNVSLIGSTINVLKTVAMPVTKQVLNNALLVKITDIQASDIIVAEIVRDTADTYTGNVGIIALRYRAS